MAAPHVTGTVALVFEAARRPLSIDETRNILVSTADAADIPPTVPPRTGAGRLNIEAAVAVARPTAQENVMTTSSDKAAPCCSACGRAAAMTAENEPQEELVGQISAGNVQSVIDTDLSTGVSAGTLDDALQSLWSNIAAQPNWAITGNILGGGCNAATWTPSVTLPTPPVVEVAAPTLCCIIVSGAAYFPSSVTGQVLRWVRIPRIAEFYALAASDQKAQKKRWGEAVWRARKEIAAALPGTNVTKAWIQTLSSPTLRLLIAQFADQALPVKRIDNAAKKQRGGLVNGVTNPILLYPLTEPDCYLRVIAGAEGKMEAVNTWDRGAGVSLGPIQFNAIEGHLFNFIGRLRDLDPDLYAQQLGWTVAPDSGHYDVTIAGTMLHGDAAHASDNAGFLQSGVVGNGTFAQIDATIRRDFALRFRNVVVWPHVQELIYLGCSDYLANGLAKIAQPANGIPTFDPANPNRELFILKALLLSAYVRFSSCLDPLLVALRRWTTVADKLAHILDAIDAMTSCTSHRAALRTRLAGQLKTAKEVWKVIKRLRGDTSSESVAEPEWEWDESDGEDEPVVLESWHESPEWDEAEPLLEDFGEAWNELTPCGESDEAAEDVELTPQETFARLSVFSPAELFDAFFTRSAAQTKFAPLVEVIAEPGETMPELSPGHVVVTRALGEGSLARMSVVARTEETPQGGGWSEAIESAGGTAVARPFGNGARVPANQMIFRLRSAEDISEKDDDAAAISCDGGVSLHADLVTAIRETRRLSGESLQLVKPPCAATKICPTAHRGYHPTGDATHFANLSEEGLRIAEIAGIWGTDLPALKKAKASRQVTTPNPYAPLSGFGAVAIRKDGKRELHVHRGAPVIESYVDCARWKNLANEHALGSIYTLMKRNWFERSIHRQWGTEAAIQWIGNLCRFYKDQTGLMLGIGDISFIVGGKMDDHESHKHGLDVDVYVLEYPAGTPFPEAYWCEGEKTLSLSAMTPPAAT
ncbi:MAG TPA: penicillin-insensitive murein endopeptidase, partial [Thermoanaerobaculia bacterium]